MDATVMLWWCGLTNRCKWHDLDMTLLSVGLVLKHQDHTTPKILAMFGGIRNGLLRAHSCAAEDMSLPHHQNFRSRYFQS